MFFRFINLKIILGLSIVIFLSGQNISGHEFPKNSFSQNSFPNVYSPKTSSSKVSSQKIYSQPVSYPNTSFSYPNPKTVGVNPKVIRGKTSGSVYRDRYAKISETERQHRILEDQCNQEIEGFEPKTCPLCEEDPKTPCGQCKMCQAGFPCEKTLCRHCVQPRSQNMPNSCDLTAGDEPCGTCDACREHRSDPCEHADDGFGPRGEFNPYKEPRFLSVIPRPILDVYNNGARKFPVYYNPAPYYRPHWNPSLFAGYARPFSFRWSCPLCHKNPCECDQPGFAGQVPYAYTCKFCNRNPCACTRDICNVTEKLDPKGTSKSLADMKEKLKPSQNTETRQEEEKENDTLQNQNRSGSLFDDNVPLKLQNEEEEQPATEPKLQRRPILDVPDSPSEPPLRSDVPVT
ncbi:MAG: hypothetical protein LBP87_13530 [Planctomycetaceae bacterium]|jgi:hypothetical protein|nr:hypothetical protein [Planctomycetaceae bacterium]